MQKQEVVISSKYSKTIFFEEMVKVIIYIRVQ